MLKEKENLLFNQLTEGEASLLISARNQELKALVAQKNNNLQLVDFHNRIAIHFRNSVIGLHQSTTTALAFLHNGQETNAVNSIVFEAMKKTQPSIKLSNRTMIKSLESVQSALAGSPVDEFDPTSEQIQNCVDFANNEAAKVYDEFEEPSKFVNLLQQIYAECIAKVPYENIVNKKLEDAGPLALYRLFPEQITFNPRVNNRIVQQSAWIKETADITGLSFENVKMIMENGTINQLEETPQETLFSISNLIVQPDTPIPTDFQISTPQNSSNKFQIIITIIKLVIAAANAIVNAIKKRRQDTFKSVKDPSLVAPRCEDTNVDVCKDGGDSDEDNNSTIALIAAGAAVVGLIALSRKKQTEQV